MRQFLDSSDAINHGAELYKRVQRDGYLFLRDVIPPRVLADARLELLGIAKKNNWLINDAPLEDGIANLAEFCVEPEPAYRKVFRQMYCLEPLHAIPHHPNLVGLFERILGAAVLLHPRIQLRVVFPRRGRLDDYSTRAHQDFLKVQGTAETFTAWIPLSDCPREMGSLAIAEGSHVNGLYDFQPARGYGLVEIVEPFSGQWVSGDYRLGDLSIHHSMVVHKALPDRTNRLRLSLDCRYQRVSEPVNAKCLNPDGQPLVWEKLYAGWHRQDLQYYWRKWELNATHFDSSVNRKRDRLAFEGAARGDRNSIATLRLIMGNDPDPTKRQRAGELLKTLET